MLRVNRLVGQWAQEAIHTWFPVLVRQSQGRWVRVFDLSFRGFFELLLGWRYLLDHDPHHRVPPGISIRPGFLPHTVPDIDSHSDGSCRNSLAITTNVMHSVYVGVCVAMVWSNVNKTINGEWTATFRTIEGEKPALTAIQKAIRRSPLYSTFKAVLWDCLVKTQS